VWTAIFEYGLNFNEPELSGISKTIFTLIKPQLTANIAKYHNGKKAKVKQKESKPEAKGKQVKSKTEGNVNDNVNDNVNGNNNEIYYFKIGKDSYKQKPSELWNTIYRGQLEAICMNQLRGVDVHLLLSTFDTDSATKEFDDYIANPKPNGYQSIHTVIKGPDDKLVEIQIGIYRLSLGVLNGISQRQKGRRCTLPLVITGIPQSHTYPIQ